MKIFFSFLVLLLVAVGIVARAQVQTGSVVARPLIQSDQLVHGVAGDEQFVFVTQIDSQLSGGKVTVHDRVSGAQVRELPAPDGGFRLPIAVRVPSSGRLVVLDAGGFPSPTVPAIPKVYDYSYQVDAATGSLDATLLRSVSFDGLPLLFTEDIEVLPDGTYVVSESVRGALWLVRPDSSVVPGIIPGGDLPSDAVPGLNPCINPLLTVDGIPFASEGGFAPGVGNLAVLDGYLYFGNTCLGGIRRVAITSLFDFSRTPDARGADIQVVSERPADVQAETLKGLVFNRWDPNDKSLIVTDPYRFQLLRIDIATGEREVLLRDPVLLNFPVSAQYLPPVGGRQSLLVASDQEHRLDVFNTEISEDLLQLPFLVTEVLFS